MILRQHTFKHLMIGLSLVCTAIVVIILLTDFDGSFIGPWG